jgi:HK97 family phage major capsid protein
MDIIELKKLIDGINEAVGELRRTNDEKLAKMAKGETVGELEVKIAAIQKDLDKMEELKSQFEAFMLEMKSPDMAAKKTASDLAEECKTFNMHLRADYQAKGRAMPEQLDVDGYKHYKSGIFKLIAGQKFEQLSDLERKAMSAGSDPDGGWMLPPSTTGMIVQKQYDQSVMRQICDVQTITAGAVEGIVDNDEVDAGWVTEIGARTVTDTSTIGKYKIEAEEMYASPKVTQKLLDDAPDIESWLAGKVADKLSRVEGTAFWQGTGVGQPRGLATYTTVATGDATRAWGEFEYVKTGANGAFHTDKFDPIVTLEGAFKDQYLLDPNYVMRREVRTALRKLKEATSDRYLWEPSNQVGVPGKLNGIPVRIDQYMPALATNSLSLALGDFKKAYKIVDRMGIRVLRDPFTAKPYVVFYTTKRVGGGAQNTEAVKFLSFRA